LRVGWWWCDVATLGGGLVGVAAAARRRARRRRRVTRRVALLQLQHVRVTVRRPAQHCFHQPHITSSSSSSACSLADAASRNFDGPSAFLATLLILYFCCVLVQVLLQCGKYRPYSLSLAWYAEQGLCNGRIGGSRIFLEGVTLGTRASIEGVWAMGE